MAVQQYENELHLHPINDNEYLASIYVNSSKMINNSSTTVILDRSGSMNEQTSRFVTVIIPMVMSILGYDHNYRVNLITFAAESKTYRKTCSQLKVATGIMSKGKTNFGPAIAALRELLELHERQSPSIPMRVLTISDGEINDPNDAIREMKKLVNFLATSDLTINSQAVRLFTSSSQPDTKALSYMLRLNNTVVTRLYDARTNEADRNIADNIARLFLMDCFHNHQFLNFQRSIVLKFPWNTHACMRVILSPGWNIFWFKHVPSGVRLGNDTVNVVVRRELSLGTFHELMEWKLEYITDHMIILKIVDTKEAITNVNEILECLKRHERTVAYNSSTPNTDIISNLLKGIANSRTNFHDSNQMATFLRETKAKMDIQREYDRKRREEENIAAEAARIKQQEEERRRREADAEAARIKQREDEERRRREADAEAARIKQQKEEEEKRRREAEAARIKQQQEEEEKRRREAEAEAARIIKLEEEKAAEEEEARIKLEEEKAAEEEEARIKLEEQKAAKEEEARIKKLEEEKAAEEEEVRIKKLEEEKAAEEEEARIKLEEEKAAEEEEARIKKLEEEKAAEEEEARIKLEEEKAAEEEEARIKLEEEKAAEEEEARINKLEEEKAAEEEEARIKKLKEEARIKKLEEEAQIKKLEEEKTAEEQEGRIKLEEEKAAEEEETRIKLEVQKAAEEEEARIKKLAEEARMKKLEEETAAEEETERDKRAEEDRLDKELDITSLNDPDDELGSSQTVFILDEHLCGARGNRRLTKQIVPLMLSRLFYESSDLVQLVTFVRYKTTFEQLRQSLLQTLDAKRQIRIFVLTNERYQERKDINVFAEMLIRFLSVTNYSFELQVVRLTSTRSTTERYEVVDVSESNDFIAKQIAGYEDKQLNDLRMQDYVGRYCCFNYIFFVIIFIILILRYIYLFSTEDK
ncbi:myosin-2-like isoform X17 [Bradysia coprophila]|uniref:myosin-2-like isoform X17 n=1 Tax=Bradysia coprophila TaxID=38358 RepID=UPI00187D75B8|nr:myosin-2-like isoform X17 [Bradysia coprophila]